MGHLITILRDMQVCKKARFNDFPPIGRHFDDDLELSQHQLWFKFWSEFGQIYIITSSAKIVGTCFIAFKFWKIEPPFLGYCYVYMCHKMTFAVNRYL